MATLTAEQLHERINGQQAYEELINTPYFSLVERYAAEGVDPHAVYLKHVRDWNGRVEGAQRLMLAVRYLQGLGE